ncbi:glycosyltransferase family 4 protein [Halalkalibacterium halodurans]|uniref:glycosyltransferase family 4 protein n=1 Tax=Halalkalibacterium halodurans TaxID=86665 RepID=UPI002AA9AD58|nr:glycosyltransferase family 4 protein [Halalkalibacterium halodurans]MDY7222857.1 glycosyltransferase family 4 protein [Halalkalibacterium halodurans]MDY7242078.1 glycosyltransferase family 4 protein [Halalkalibacterium halodurans]
MKVLIICTEKLPVPPIRGGAIQTYISGALPALKNKHDLTVLSVSDPDLPDEEVVDNVRYVRVPGKLLHIYQKNVEEYLSSAPTFELIHIFNRPRLVRPVREAAPKARIVLSMHNDMFKREKITPEEAAYAIEQVDKIITISQYIGETIKQPFPQAEPKLQTIYSGVDLDRFVPIYSQKARSIRDQLRQEHQLEGKKVILFSGRLSANKGADVLVRAMHELGKSFSNAALVLMGSKWFSDDGVTDYVAYVRSLANRSPIPVVTTGFVNPMDIHKWYAAADLFVCPSQWQEPLARVHYEAMASGLPIVTTARGGNPEVIEQNKNGLVVEDVENPTAFAQELSKLLADPQLCLEMGRYGRQLAEEKYSWDRVVRDIEQVWNEIQQLIHQDIPIGKLIKDGTTAPLEDQETALDQVGWISDLSQDEPVENEEIQVILEELAELEGVLKGIRDRKEEKEDTRLKEEKEEKEGALAEEETIAEKASINKVKIYDNNPPSPPWLNPLVL